jgi:mannose-6-phosphate isomerase-like protein (cupin superfamily)
MHIYKITKEPQTQSPAGAEIRLDLSNQLGSIAHLTMPKGKISRPVTHKTVTEYWYIISGQGEFWSSNESGVDTVSILEPGTVVEISLGTKFQFRAAETSELVFICMSMPQWPGDSEVTFLEKGNWEPIQ